MSKKYVKKDCTVRAVEWDGFNLHELVRLDPDCIGDIIKSDDDEDSPYRLVIHATHGEAIISKGDYVVKTYNGEIYVYPGLVFHAQYEKLN